MEKISINTDKKKRGRPPTEIAEAVEKIKFLYPDIKTRRGLYNKLFCSLGGEMVRNSEIENKSFLFNLEDNICKSTILAELGRIEYNQTKEDTIFLAREICKRKLTTREAVYLIKEFIGIRTGKAVDKDTKIQGIVIRIINVLNRARLTTEDMVEVLRLVNISVNDEGAET